ncbi:uncharacterized protein [Linepithema humile]|uniref:uncharacterized protein n=1 Tax=Linepithema humile TaxID=83485 RepID=UPI000623B068|nr:PREDICTED: uncharacterized protein LOC105668988 [Linepithema humile]
MAWCICHFQINDFIQVIPNNWIISKRKCAWPSLTTKLSELIKKREIPTDDWETMRIKVLAQYDNYEIAQTIYKTTFHRDNLSSLSESVEYGKGLRVPKSEKKYSDRDTDTENKCSEEELSINFPIYKADKTIFSPNSAHKNSANKAHSNKSNNNVYQVGESKKQHSDNILAEIHTNFQKHADETKDFQRQVLQYLHSIDGRMEKLNEYVESLKQPNFPVDQENANQNMTSEQLLQFTTCIERLPVKSDNELQEIEKILENKPIFYNVATELSKIGGNNLQIIVKQVMYRILTPKVGRKYNWGKRKQKLAFRDLFLAKLVLISVRFTMMKRYVNIIDDEIIICIRDWLSEAK